MRKFAFCFSGLMLAVYGGLVSAQEAYGANTYQYRLHDRRLAPAPSQNSRQPRWRPLEEESGNDSGSTPNRQMGSYPGVSDYTDEPFGLPPGTYRRIEERHIITPHFEGYRFRPIDPDEQLRNQTRNQAQDQIKRKQRFPQPARQDGWGEVDRLWEQSPAMNFRPDPRLDKQRRETPQRYAYPMGSDAPVFRP